MRSRTHLVVAAAVSRENLGQVYEAMGRLEEAKAVRLRAPDMVCTNYDVSALGC
jgi:hypothetical protein